MIYKHTFVLSRFVESLIRHGWKLKGSVHPTPDGALAVVENPTTGISYRLSMEPICEVIFSKSEVFVIPNTIDKLLEKGGI